MRSAFLLALILPLPMCAQDGATIFNQRCASCHTSPAGRVPPLSAIKAMSPQAIYAALTEGTMKAQADGLSMAEIVALIKYIAPTGKRVAPPLFPPTCKANPNIRVSADLAQWNGWSPDVTNSRFQDARQAGFAAPAVPRLKVKWAFNLGNVTSVRSQPSVAAGWLSLVRKPAQSTLSTRTPDARIGAFKQPPQSGPARPSARPTALRQSSSAMPAQTSTP